MNTAKASNVNEISPSVKAVKKNAKPAKRRASGKAAGRPAKKKTIFSREKKTIEMEVPVVHVADLVEFIEKVVDVRQLPNKETLLLKLGIDEGQKLLKACLSIIHLLGESDPNKKAFEQRFRDSGVKKVFVVGVTPAKETHSNLKKLLILMGCNKIQLTIRISSDIKCINLMLGIGCAASTHPCPFCHWQKAAGDNGDWDLRTFQSIIDHYKAWMASGGKQKDLKRFYNCQNLPLKVYIDARLLVLHVYCLPVLHLLQGIFNTAFRGIEAFFPGIVAWPKKLKIKREEYHGRIFEGGACKRLLENTEMMLDIPGAEEHEDKLKRFVVCLDAFHSIVSGTFGQDLDPNWESHLAEFRSVYLELSLPITPKVHCIFRHLRDFVSQSAPLGLAFWSEQTPESAHHDFQCKWAHHKVNDVTHKAYGPHLQAAVRSYNSKHL